ncbi:hypothetical protein Q8F55_001665 [Vanrija albida]|uniref:F-box domain-containing protein n=1 Tax=Vanrija albida TaxID=181172 RepID=A0ABR3Q7K5_9TREE
MATSDPLTALGHDIFVDVLSHLGARDLVHAELVSKAWLEAPAEHAVALWRSACYADDVEPALLSACERYTAGGIWRSERDECNARLNPYALLRRETEGEGGEEKKRHVDWRYLCKTHTELDTAWKHARARVRWLTPPTNAVWRIKSLLDENVLLCTGRTEGVGLAAIDRTTSQLLFSISGVSAWTHLEAGRGFAVFDRAEEETDDDDVMGTSGESVVTAELTPVDSVFEVWRNENARSRPGALPPTGVSPIAHTAESHYIWGEGEYRPGDESVPLPPGHMEFYRVLTPPVRCLAFRLHVDDADGPHPRAVLAACGMPALYIWHLEEERPVDVIKRTGEDKGRVNYIELDDHHIFVCHGRQMHVYSRATGTRVVSFPQLGTAARDAATVAFPLSIKNDFKAIPDEERHRDAPDVIPGEGVPALIGRANVVGAVRGEPGFDGAIANGIARHPIRIRPDQVVDIDYEFTACHFTSTDLVCTTKTGAVFVVRRYTDVLNESLTLPEEERAAFIALNTVVIGMETPLKWLTTYRDRIAIVTQFNVVVIDGKQFPDVPRGPTPAPVPGLASSRPKLQAHVLLGNHPQAVKMASCVQMDYRGLYLTYWALGEFEGSRHMPDEQAALTFPPPRT